MKGTFGDTNVKAVRMTSLWRHLAVLVQPAFEPWQIDIICTMFASPKVPFVWEAVDTGAWQITVILLTAKTWNSQLELHTRKIMAQYLISSSFKSMNAWIRKKKPITVLILLLTPEWAKPVKTGVCGTQYICPKKDVLTAGHVCSIKILVYECEVPASLICVCTPLKLKSSTCVDQNMFNFVYCKWT